MWEISDIVNQDLKKFVPLSIINDISCFVFNDNHPRDAKLIDIVTCTKNGEVKEFFQHEEMSSILLETKDTLRDVRSIRNSKCELFYLVATKIEVFILSGRMNLQLLHKITDVERYEMHDTYCNGHVTLRVYLKDDAVPLIYDDNFQIITESSIDIVEKNDDESMPVVHLKRKLIEAKYSVQCNENTYKEFSNMRQRAIFYNFQRICPNIDETFNSINFSEIASSMKIKTWNPWIKVCNKKVVIVFNLINKNDVAIDNVGVLLHSSNKSVIYNTKLFEPKLSSPYWEEKSTQKIVPNKEMAVVTIIDIEELQSDVVSKMKFSMVLCFTKTEKDYMLPFDEVIISASDIMGADFDVLSSKDTDVPQAILAVQATSEKIELCFRHIKNDGDLAISEIDIFCKHLKMEVFGDEQNVVIHRQSPYHILHGVMIVFMDTEKLNDNVFTVSVYTRLQSQILALIHYIYDAIPYRLVITTPSYKITANVEQLSKYNEEIHTKTEQSIDYVQYASSVLKQLSVLQEYFDSCMMKMNESKDPSVQNKVGTVIDVFAGGKDHFNEFKKKFLEESFNGIHNSQLRDVNVMNESGVMIVDDL